MNQNFITTNGILRNNFKNCLLDPIPMDDTLWFPFNINKLSDDFYLNISNLSFEEICLIVLSEILRDDIDSKDLKKIINDSFNFEIPMKSFASSNICILEMFNGPTFTFKDVGARFMSRILKHYFSKDKFDIIVSTSGDTGSAVADAFQDLENVKVHILYPKDKISIVQEKQLTTYGNNVFAYCTNGNFDDCQKLIKETLKDKTLNSRLKFFPANSINITRLIPQCLYYFWGYAQYIKHYGKSKKPVFCIPSGNLGNLSGLVLARELGLPVEHIIGATNINNTFEKFLNGEDINDNRIAKETLSNAMDISIPNNLKRLKYVFGDNINMKNHITSYSFDDKSTLSGIVDFYNKYNYSIDPHTSVGYLAIKKDKMKYENRNYILISTAHPAKFYETMDKVNIPYDIPEGIKKLNQLKNRKIYLENNYNKWKEMLLKNSMKSVTFIGMPFSGKSYIGKLLATKLSKEFVDFDKKLEEKFNKDLGTIVSNLSSEEFKIEEENIVIDYIKKSKVPTILSPGGSIIYCKKAMEYIKKNSLVVYLDTPLEILLKRYEEFSKGSKSRGIVFKNGMGYADLFEERKELYESNYDIKIKSTEIELILKCLS